MDREPILIVSFFEWNEIYVAKGFGIGLTAVIPGMKPPAALRRNPLPDFDPLPRSPSGRSGWEIRHRSSAR